MDRVRIEDVDTPPSSSPADVLHPLSGKLDTDSIVLNYFELAPSESFGYAYHRHLDQEEVFYVQSGTATFETEPGDIGVSAGEVIGFDPGEFQLGHDRETERVTALAIGVPQDSTEIEYLRACPSCEEKTIRVPEPTEQETLLVRCTERENVVDGLGP
jgi:uncharacterized cupin superfamily protein